MKFLMSLLIPFVLFSSHAFAELNSESRTTRKTVTGVEARAIFEALTHAHRCQSGYCEAHAYRIKCVRTVATGRNAGPTEDCRYYMHHPEGEVVALYGTAATELRYVLSEITQAEKRYTQRTRGVEVARVYCEYESKVNEPAIEWGNPSYTCRLNY